MQSGSVPSQCSEIPTSWNIKNEIALLSSSAVVSSSTTIILAVLVSAIYVSIILQSLVRYDYSPILIIIIIISHHSSNHHTTHHTRTKTKSRASTSAHTTALSSLRLSIHALLWISTISTTHHRLLSIHALLLWVATTHHWLLSIHALLSIALLRIASTTILLLLRS
jgi:hypothetical protein